MGFGGDKAVIKEYGPTVSDEELDAIVMFNRMIIDKLISDEFGGRYQFPDL